MLLADTDSQALERWDALFIVSSPRVSYETLGLEAATCLTHLSAESQSINNGTCCALQMHW